MPDTFSNPYGYQSPIGAALANLGNAISSGPTEAQKIIQAESALKLQRERQGVTDVASVFRSYGQPGFDRNRAISSAILGGYDPEKLAVAERYGSANTFGTSDPRTTNAFVGAGGAFGSTPAGFDIAQRNEMEKAAATPQVIGSPTGPIIVRRDASYNQPAVEDLNKVKGDFARRAITQPGGIDNLSPTEQHFVGAQPTTPHTPRMYMAPDGSRHVTYDGITSAQNGQPLPPGGSIFNVQGDPNSVGLRPAVQGKLQEADIANQRFRGLIGFTRNLAQQDANNFGVTGIVKSVVQDVNAVAGNVSQGLGYKGLQEAANDVRQKVLAAGVNPQLFGGAFDANLPALHTAADLMVFSAAEALAGQSGRSVSDKDIVLMRRIVGDPREWLGNQQKFLANLDTVEQVLNLNQGVVDKNLRPGGAAPAAAGAPAAPGTATVPQAPQAVPGAPPVAQPVKRFERVNGVLQRVQ